MSRLRGIARNKLKNVARQSVIVPSIEQIVSSEDWFGLTNITPLQRFICRVLGNESLSDFYSNSAVTECVGGIDAYRKLCSLYPTDTLIREVYLLAGIRTAKSLMAAALAIKLSQTANLTGLLPGEVVRIPIVSTDKDKANAVIEHLDTISKKPLFESLLVGKPSNGCYTVRHPLGNRVEIMVVAGSRAGSTLTSRWCLGVIFDEWPRMMGGEHVVNFNDCRKAVMARIRPGGILFGLGSPWGPIGPAYETHKNHFGKPTSEIVVLKGRGKELNPVWWNEERITTLLKTINGEDIVLTEERAEFGKAEWSPFTDFVLKPLLIADGIQPVPTLKYFACIDPATRRNAWTLVIGTVDHDGRLVIVNACEWQGTTEQPLSPNKVFFDIFRMLHRYRIDSLYSCDLWSFDSNVDIASDFGIALVEAKFDSVACAKELLNRCLSDKVRLPNCVADDLRQIQIRKTQRSETLHLPTIDRRHCDFVPPLLALVDKIWYEPVNVNDDVDEDELALERKFNAQRNEEMYA